MALPTLPTPPARSDPANFAARADAFFAALPAWAVAFNAMVPAAVAGAVTGSFSVSGNAQINGYTNIGASTNVERLTIGPASVDLTPGDSYNIYVGTGGLSKPAVTINVTYFELMRFKWRDTTTVGSITTNGTSTTYATSSDVRLKTNIVPAADAGGLLDAIEVVSFDWLAGGHTDFGMIAQALHAIAPDAVNVGDDGAEVEKTWGVDYSKLVPLLVKEVQSLRARVAALEG